MGNKHSKKASETSGRRTSEPLFHKFTEPVDSSEGISSQNTNNTPIISTPDTEVSPPESPTAKVETLIDPNDQRANARSLAASLSLEEQVSSI